MEPSLCRQDWPSHWLIIVELSLQPRSLPRSLEAGAQSPLLMAWCFCWPATIRKLPRGDRGHLNSINSDVDQRGLLRITRDAPVSYHPGNTRVLRVLCPRRDRIPVSGYTTRLIQRSVDLFIRGFVSFKKNITFILIPVELTNSVMLAYQRCCISRFSLLFSWLICILHPHHTQL